jgi:hypothetical protein
MYCGYNLLFVGESRRFYLSPLIFGSSLLHLFSTGLSELIATGDYRTDINEELYNHNINADENHVQHSLFKCDDSGNGEIAFRDYCSAGCKDGGSGKNDSC